MSEESIARLFVNESGELLEQALVKIRHCLSQLSTGQIWWRSRPADNSIGNLLLHISGNLRQWTVSGIAGGDDDRDRDHEFACTEMIPARELIEHAEATVSAARNVFESLTVQQLSESRDIQGFNVTVLQAVMHTASHFVGHTHQIVFITRMILGDKYRFQWSGGGDRGQLPI